MTNLPVRTACLLLVVIAVTGCESGGDAGKDIRTAHPASSGILIVSYDQGTADTITAPGADSMIVMDWLRYGCDSLKLPLEVQEYAFGDLVIGIGSTQNGDDGYWLYKVNGESVPKAVSAHRVSSGDTVLFFFK